MKTNTKAIRFLVSDKKGIEKRVRTAIASAGGCIEGRRLARQMRGLCELELFVSSPDPRLFGEITESLDQLSGVMVLGIVDVEDSMSRRSSV